MGSRALLRCTPRRSLVERSRSQHGAHEGDEGDEGNEGDEGPWRSYDKGRTCRSARYSDGPQKVGVRKVMGTLAEIGAGEVKSTGIFTLPGLCRIKTRVKPATKAGKKMMFGKEVVVKAKPAKTVVKAFAVAALKRTI